MFVFTLEYILRLWTCNLKQEYSSPIMGRIRYMLTPAAFIDLVVVIPFYLPFFFNWTCVFFGCTVYSDSLPCSKWPDIQNLRMYYVAIVLLCRTSFEISWIVYESDFSGLLIFVFMSGVFVWRLFLFHTQCIPFSGSLVQPILSFGRKRVPLVLKRGQ